MTSTPGILFPTTKWRADYNFQLTYLGQWYRSFDAYCWAEVNIWIQTEVTSSLVKQRELKRRIRYLIFPALALWSEVWKPVWAFPCRQVRCQCRFRSWRTRVIATRTSSFTVRPADFARNFSRPAAARLLPPGAIAGTRGGLASREVSIVRVSRRRARDHLLHIYFLFKQWNPSGFPRLLDFLPGYKLHNYLPVCLPTIS